MNDCIIHVCERLAQDHVVGSSRRVAILINLVVGENRVLGQIGRFPSKGETHVGSKTSISFVRRVACDLFPHVTYDIILVFVPM